MFLTIDNVLDNAALTQSWALLADPPWVDGAATAGHHARGVKMNLQLPDQHEVTQALQHLVLAALAANPLFQALALPRHIVPPLFNRYADGGSYGTHVDNAIRLSPKGQAWRTDLAATLFLSDPADYDGGALVVEDGPVSRSYKLPAGSLLVYPATTLHRVDPVTRGARLAAVLWVQSLVADAARRAILFDMDMALQSLRPRIGDRDAALVALTAAYHNLLRQWAAP